MYEKFLYCCSVDAAMFAAQNLGASVCVCCSVASASNLDKGCVISKLTISDIQEYILMSSAELHKLPRKPQ